MASTSDELPSVVYGDIENLNRELELLAASSKPPFSEQGRDASVAPDTILIRGK
jgi:hypothetical protein